MQGLKMNFINISDLPGSWFTAGTLYQGKVLAELPDAFYSVQFYHEPRHVPYQKVTVGANAMLGWTFYSSEDEYLAATAGKKDWLPSPTNLTYEKSSTIKP